MSYLRWTLGAWVVISLVLPCVNQADEPQLMPRAGVLVLRTDRVLRGNILRVGDRYVVTMREHDEVSVAVDAVALRCDSLTDAYQHKRRELPPAAKVADHLKLADWCLRYDLMQAAAEQLMAAQRRDPLDPANARFEKRLKFAANQVPTPAPRPRQTTQYAALAELDAQMRSLPAGVVAQFTHTVQPLLINRCGGGNCHGVNSTAEFRILSTSRARTIPRRFTQRNLLAVLELLDRKQPGRSPLLMMSALPHGGAENPPLRDKDVEQTQRLAEWIFRCLSETGPQPPAVLKTPDTFLLQPFEQPGQVTGNSSTTDTPASSKRDAGPAARGTDPAVQLVGHAEPLQTPTKPRGSTGIDPFDPEIFNRRYLNRDR